MSVPSFDPDTLEYRGVDDKPPARLGRVIDDQHIAAGSSPSTIAIIDMAQGRRLTAVNLTLVSCVHGLECWPANWP